MADYATEFDVDANTVQPFGHPILIWDGPQPLHTHRALLAGEAACVVDPFTAEGIRPAIFSGLKAAEAISQALQGDDQALPRYSDVMNREWGEEMHWAKRLAQVVYQAPGLAYHMGVKRPTSTLTMAKIFAGETRYADVVHRAVQRLMRPSF